MLKPDTIVKRKAGLLASIMDGETVMLDVDSGHYFGLSGAGSHIWNMLEEERSVAAVVDDVKAQYAVGTGDNVDEDVIAFLQKLVDKSLIGIADEDA